MIASRALATPLAIAAIALLVVNDHVLKAAYPGLVTGKLSDFAGLMFFPLLLAAAIEQLGVRRGMTTIVAATVATAFVFAAIKLSPAAGELYRSALASLQWPIRALGAVIAGDPVPAVGHVQLTADRTDLIALIALAVPLGLGLGHRQRGATSWPALRRPRRGSLLVAGRSTRDLRVSVSLFSGAGLTPCHHLRQAHLHSGDAPNHHRAGEGAR